VTQLITLLEEVGDLNEALSFARHAAATDPLREEGQVLLIRLLAATDQPGAALRQYKEFERLLEDESGDEPSGALRALFRQIERQTGLAAPPATAAAPRPRTENPCHHSRPPLIWE
jgi:DNA-binding SARP family transcriptional activator